jgi:hypothetical protein
MSRETTYMHFVYDGLRRGPIEGRVAFPIVGTRICHHALHRRGGIVTFLSGGIATVVIWNHHAPSVWVEKYFGRIESQSAGRIEGSFDSITVDLPCLHPRYEHVPIVICAARCRIAPNDTRGPSIIDAIKQEQLDRCCVL